MELHTHSLWSQSGSTHFHARVARDRAPAHAPTVVLLHGVGGSSRCLLPTLERLAPFCRVYAPDLPGFGLSTRCLRALDPPGLADALASWMQASGVGRASVLATSTGCQAALRLALRHPERLERLILVGPGPEPRAGGTARHLGRWLRNARREPPALGALLLSDVRRAGPRRMLRSLRDTLRDGMEGLLPQVRHPTLVVRGARDVLAPEAWVRHMLELLPHGRLITIPGAPHSLTYDSPLELARVVRPFLEQRLPREVSDRHLG